MACKLGDFEGTWKVTVGLREGHELTLEKVVIESQYKLSDETSGETLYDHLALDNVAFTLENDVACLSLGKDCGHLFGIEWDADESKYYVWCAERVSGGSSDTASLSETPDWRLDEKWIVKAVGGEPPVGIEDMVIITETQAEEHDYEIFKVGDPEPIAIDTLNDNEPNRTLDGDYRSVASWDRGEPNRCIFAMVIVPDEIVQRIKQFDIERIKEELRKLGGLLPFEVEMLAESIVNGDGGGDPGVWGAEEGG
ncbi:MAG: hypothetical protein GY856_00355 [bacterium]|nr:hypothetical protein [bacterium]